MGITCRKAYLSSLPVVCHKNANNRLHLCTVAKTEGGESSYDFQGDI